MWYDICSRFNQHYGVLPVYNELGYDRNVCCKIWQIHKTTINNIINSNIYSSERHWMPNFRFQWLARKILTIRWAKLKILTFTYITWRRIHYITYLSQNKSLQVLNNHFFRSIYRSTENERYRLRVRHNRLLQRTWPPNYPGIVTYDINCIRVKDDSILNIAIKL